VLRDVRGAARAEPVPPADAFVEMFGALAAAQHDDALRERLYDRALLQARLLERIRSIG
jgi:hypothetical protein